MNLNEMTVREAAEEVAELFVSEACIDKCLSDEAQVAIDMADAKGSEEAAALRRAIEAINDAVTQEDGEAAHSDMVEALAAFEIDLGVYCTKCGKHMDSHDMRQVNKGGTIGVCPD